MLVFLLQISFENRNSYVVNRSFKKKAPNKSGA
jgi:hypothetical protein